MLVRYNWASSVIDCRAYTGAQTGSEHGSDHAMPAGVGEALLERDGRVISDQARKLGRWEEHFKKLLNHVAPPNTTFSPLHTPAAENDPCEVGQPTLDEVCTAIRQLRNNRAPGEDGMPAEVYKMCLEFLGPWLHREKTKGRLCEAVPNNWKYR